MQDSLITFNLQTRRFPVFGRDGSGFESEDVGLNPPDVRDGAANGYANIGEGDGTDLEVDTPVTSEV